MTSNSKAVWSDPGCNAERRERESQLPNTTHRFTRRGRLLPVEWRAESRIRPAYRLVWSRIRFLSSFSLS